MMWVDQCSLVRVASSTSLEIVVAYTPAVKGLLVHVARRSRELVIHLSQRAAPSGWAKRDVFVCCNTC